MAVYAPSGSGNVHVDIVLTNISLGWPNNGLVGEQLFPVVPVKKQSNKYYTFGREAWFPEAGDYRAPGTEANEIPGLAVSVDSYYAQEHALQIAIPDEERENADSPLSPDSDGTGLVTQKILLGREKAMQTLVTDPTQYATTNTVTLSGTSQWNDYTNSDPISNVKTGIRAIHSHIFMEPNVMVLPYQVMSTLEDHPKFIQRIQYAERGIITPDIMAALFMVPKIIVPGVGVATSASLVPGYLWGKDVLLAWVPPRPGLKIPAFGYEFGWGAGGGLGNQFVDRWREDRRVSDLIRVRRRYDLKLVGRENNPNDTNVGKVVAGYLIKQAIA